MSVPALRFPEFVGDWEEKPLGAYFEEFKEKSIKQDQHEVLTSARSGLVRQKDYYDNDRITDRENVGFNIIPPNYLTYRSRSDDRRFFFNENDLGITGIISVYYPVFRIMDGDNNFFAELLAKNSDHIGRYSVGTSQTVLSMNELKRIKLHLPNPPEQKKIAAFLGVVDAKIAALRAQRDGLERYKRGLMQALFSQRLRFTKPDGSAFPDWEEKRLGDLVDWIRTNSLSRENLNYQGGEAQNIHYGDIHTKFRATFRQSQERVPYVSAGAVPKGFSDDEFCQVGDVVIADASEDYADIGKAIEIVELTETPLVAGLHTYIARPKGGLALGFSGYLLRSASMRKQIMRIAQGISVLGISKTNLEKLVLPMPHPCEQTKIADALSAMDTKIAAVGDQVAKMETFKKGLLQQMFV